MAAFEETIKCDICGDYDPLWTMFCLTCGFDVCGVCKLTHDAMHEFATETTNGTETTT